jgi:hypothetical protein
MCTATWINVKVWPVVAAASKSDKGKGDQKRRPRVQTTVNGMCRCATAQRAQCADERIISMPIEALVDSGASVSVMSEKAFKTVGEHWNMQCLPLSAALTISGVNGEKIDVTGYVQIPLQMEDGKPGEVRTFTRPVLVLSGIEPNNLILSYDFIQ